MESKIWLCSLCSLLAVQSSSEKVLFEFGQDFDVNTVEVQDARVSLSSDEDGGCLRVNTGHNARWPGIILKAPGGNLHLSSYSYITVDVRNVGENRVTVHWRIDNPGADGTKNCITNRIALEPGEKRPLKAFLHNSLPEHLAPKLFAMRGYPGGLVKGQNFHPAMINQFLFFVNAPTTEHSFEISNIRAGGSYIPPEWLSMSESEFFPMIDEYGQFIHEDWPGKVKSIEDFAHHKEEEAADLANHPGPENWNSYGGWAAGPQLEATGYFRVEKYEGKWWLVDPDGRLFWSHGIDCVQPGNAYTPISERKYLFKNLPEKDTPLGQFYGIGSWSPHNYYGGRDYEMYNFTSANLLRKYGQNWRQQHAEIAHRRLRSWGMNTIANWSDPGIYLMRRTPYVVPVRFGGRLLEGSEGYWGKFRDVFDPSFREEVRKSMAWQKDRTAGDPWCIGYFVDNEISWGNDVSLAVATLISPQEQPAKKVFVEDLKTKYKTIKNLNQVWGTQHASWDALLESREAPDVKKAYADLAAFYTKLAETYFRTCRDAVKEVAPNNLYLGCRFSSVNDRAVKAAAKFCDVVSYNFYRRDISGFRLPLELDKPVIVGEFHFGALDRGMFHTGLVPTENQAQRAEAYKNYVSGALRNPFFVGTHWFQYGDQATTGRGDGENYQIGFLSVTDTPYLETIQACREVGYRMYEYRLAE